jgi:hypothetical protein
MSIKGFTVISTTQHWYLQGGVWYRDCIVRDPDGNVWEAGVRDDLLGGVA